MTGNGRFEVAVVYEICRAFSLFVDCSLNPFGS